MARGRIISSKIALDKRINDLSNDTSRLAFTWLITFADAEGKTHGDPAVVRSMLFPRRVDISIEEIESYITEWQDSDLIVWYEAEGDMFIMFVGFDKNQPNLRRDREAASTIPDPEGCRRDENGNVVELRTNSGLTQAQLPVKLIKEKFKLREDNHNTNTTEANAQNNDGGGDDRLALLSTLYQSEIGPITPMIAEELKDAADTYPEEWYKPAFELAASRNARNWKYVRKVFENWQADGFESWQNKQNGSGKTQKSEKTRDELIEEGLQLWRQRKQSPDYLKP